MRIALLTIIILLGAHLGLVAMDSVKDMQDKRMDQLCKLDSSYCNK